MNKLERLKKSWFDNKISCLMMILTLRLNPLKNTLNRGNLKKLSVDKTKGRDTYKQAVVKS